MEQQRTTRVADERLHLWADAFGSEYTGHQYGDDTHGFRCVIGTMTDAECSRRKVLQYFEDFVDLFSCRVLEDSQEKAFEEEAQKQTNQR